jgi:hypothetical protein
MVLKMGTTIQFVETSLSLESFVSLVSLSFVLVPLSAFFATATTF